MSSLIGDAIKKGTSRYRKQSRAAHSDFSRNYKKGAKSLSKALFTPSKQRSKKKLLSF